MPELAAVYALGLLTSAFSTFLFLVLWRRRKTARPAVTLNSNLKKIGLFWSEHHDRIETWEEGIEERDWQASARSFGLLGAMLSALSWGGFVLLLILIVSIRALARSRLEKNLFSSPLARESSLSPERVREIVDPLRPGS